MKIMKKTLYILAIIGLFLGGCDKIEEPFLDPTGGSGPGPGEKVRKVMLEEFTGHICVNCPEATKLANDLKQVFGEQLILVSIHAGDLAVPDDAPFNADYRTNIGTDIYNFYQPVGVPMGMVNRISYEGGVTLFKDSWEPAIQELLALPPEASIEIELDYNAGSRLLDVHVHNEFLDDIPRTLNICVVVIESDIISAQKNDLASVGPVPDILDYQHNHILRSSLNGTWGDLLVDQPTAGTIMTKDYSLTLNNAWDENNIGIIAYVLDANTNEIIQAEEMHLE